MSLVTEQSVDQASIAALTGADATKATAYPPGDLAIWVFILAELLVFAVFFASYAFTRMNHVDLFNQYQATLDRDAALINTLALLTSSYFVVRAVAAVREGDNRLCARWLWAGVGMGAVFLLVKAVEYAHTFTMGSFAQVALSSTTGVDFLLEMRAESHELLFAGRADC